MGASRRRREMSGAPPCQNADTSRGQALCNSDPPTHVGPNDIVDNPPNVGLLPRKLAHVRHYALDRAYIAPHMPMSPGTS
jgi:hypothetical protein